MTAPSIAWADPARASAFHQWLTALAPQHGLNADSVRLASADASFRRYFRVDAAAPAAPKSYIIMDAPPAQEDCAPFV
ncbi:MAG: aminoglycoside phosphotransferase, partial [Polaromonas sp.]|nr:aminoglycoside phosphotransferase [Polaromonas sp.]